MTELVKQENTGMMDIINNAVNKGVDVGSLEKLLDMQERIMKKNAEMSFNNDMVRLREELPTVVKNKKNTQTNSKYADLEAIQDVLYPLLSKYGFFDRYEDDYLPNGIVGTTCEIVHRDGHSKRNRVQFALDDKGIKGTVNKTELHAAASSMTYGQRLSLCRALGIKTGEDDDGNLAGTKLVTDQQAFEIGELISSVGADKAGFLKYMGVENLSLIRAGDYNKAVNALHTKAKQAKQ